MGYDRHGEKHPGWKGGRYKNSRGYVYAYSPGHPKAKTTNHIAEHILVAEKTLGRYLDNTECVHHINHNVSDNRPGNLQVMKLSEHNTIHHKDRYFKTFDGFREKAKKLGWRMQQDSKGRFTGQWVQSNGLPIGG